MDNKDFILLAEMFKKCKPPSHIDCISNIVTINTLIVGDGGYKMWKNIVDNLCDVCHTINIRFNSERFKTASGYYD